MQCDDCKLWVHQVCALFNARRNEGEADYTCPECFCEQMERGQQKPLPGSTVLGARDLPRTRLSDHLESRLRERLTWERAERAKQLGKAVDQVRGRGDVVWFRCQVK